MQKENGMPLSAKSLKGTGLKEEGETDFINLKCPPDMVSILRQSPPFLPAYHMNKTHWLTILLDHGVESEEIFKLLDWSYDLTK